MDGKDTKGLSERALTDLRLHHIFSTHDPKVMAHATAVVRIADGRVAAREVPSEAAAAGGR
jgi:ABC-type lipoprotein export system ATPase subunit